MEPGNKEEKNMAKNIVVLGASTSGTIISNMLRRYLKDDWTITVIDRDDEHIYQPGLLFVPFGIQKAKSLVKKRHKYIREGINFVIDEITHINCEKRMVKTKEQDFAYDFLVVATGAYHLIENTQGLSEVWEKNAFTFWPVTGVAEADNLRKVLRSFKKGKLVMAIDSLPFKCPVAPIEFSFLADWYFRKKELRQKIEIEYVTPMPMAFTKPKASVVFGELAKEKNIKITTNYQLDRVDGKERYLESVTGEKINYDLLVIVPSTEGAKVISDSGIDNGAGYVPTDKRTLKAIKLDRVYVLGDATNVPTSKAGSVAHYEADVVCFNIMSEIHGVAPEPIYDGHSTCFIVSEKNKSLLIDFNYKIEPLFGKFPIPKFGPFTLLKNTRMNWYGKIGFEWIYWNVLLSGRHLGMPPTLVMAGKEIE